MKYDRVVVLIQERVIGPGRSGAILEALASEAREAAIVELAAVANFHAAQRLATAVAGMVEILEAEIGDLEAAEKRAKEALPAADRKLAQAEAEHRAKFPGLDEKNRKGWAQEREALTNAVRAAGGDVDRLRAELRRVGRELEAARQKLAGLQELRARLLEVELPDLPLLVAMYQAVQS